MNRIRRLTRALESVITSLLGGRNYPSVGDSRTPFMRYEEQQFLDSEHLDYNNRHGLHLNPHKSADNNVNKIKGNE